MTPSKIEKENNFKKEDQILKPTHDCMNITQKTWKCIIQNTQSSNQNQKIKQNKTHYADKERDAC